MAIWHLAVSYLFGLFVGRKFDKYWKVIPLAVIAGFLSTFVSMFVGLIVSSIVFSGNIHAGEALQPYILLMPVSFLVSLVTAILTKRKISKSKTS
jgi:hypothetical protein